MLYKPVVPFGKLRFQHIGILGADRDVYKRQVRQDAHKVDTVLCGKQLLAFSLHKTALYQFFNDGGAGGGSSKPLSLIHISFEATAERNYQYMAL